MDNKIGAIPEFTQDEPVVEVTAQPVETPAVPAENVSLGEAPPAEPPPVEVPPVDPELVKQVEGLARDKERLMEELKALRGVKRDLKQEQINTVDQKLDELKDVNPDDVTVVEKILRNKGLITKGEAQAMFYDSVKQDEIGKFLDRYPEYKPENDPQNINWNALEREVSLYKRPDDPRTLGTILDRAHKAIAKAPQGNLQVKKQQVTVASHGAGGSQPSSQPKRQTRLSPELKSELLRGGWTAEEIKDY